MADPPEALFGALTLDDGAARARDGARDDAEGRGRAASGVSAGVADVLRDVRDALTAGLADGGDVRAAARTALALCTAHVGVSRDVLGVGDFLDAERDHFCLSVAAPTRGGKSFLVRSLALEMLDRGRVGKVYVFAGAVQAAVESYAGLGAFVYEFSDELLGQFLRSRRGKTDGCLVILDDVLGTNADKSLAVRALFSEGRHLALSCFCNLANGEQGADAVDQAAVAVHRVRRFERAAAEDDLRRGEDPPSDVVSGVLCVGRAARAGLHVRRVGGGDEAGVRRACVSGSAA